MALTLLIDNWDTIKILKQVAPFSFERFFMKRYQLKR